jgi:hypothetical protein
VSEESEVSGAARDDRDPHTAATSPASRPTTGDPDTATVTGAPAAADGPAPPVAVPTSDREAPRFAPRSQDDLAPSGAVTRVRANLAAVQMVRALQAEGRRATPDEQKVLARWSG